MSTQPTNETPLPSSTPLTIYTNVGSNPSPIDSIGDDEKNEVMVRALTLRTTVGSSAPSSWATTTPSHVGPSSIGSDLPSSPPDTAGLVVTPISRNNILGSGFFISPQILQGCQHKLQAFLCLEREREGKEIREKKRNGNSVAWTDRRKKKEEKKKKRRSLLEGAWSFNPFSPFHPCKAWSLLVRLGGGPIFDPRRFGACLEASREGRSLQAGTPEFAHATYVRSCCIEKPTGSSGTDTFQE
uniref:Uncharacterized protein n=1 Tax=Ananas comosus var. bracteatus TaxID=296719 RepID=A0A6V7PG17_ANACO|nr:unnamed protein product [Ananas comosus var. bracteatus]